jgi:hypothetical protein
MVQRAKSVLAVAAALWTGFTLKFNLFQHPKLSRTAYRIPNKHWGAFEMWEDFRRKSASKNFSVQVELRPANKEVWMSVEGVLSPSEAEVLGEHIRESLAGSKSKLVMDLKQLRWDQVENLQPLRDKLAMYRSRIRIVLPKVSLAHPELILLAAMFEAATR